jgi:pyruvate dehydrogenase E1 component alpha subunit
LSENPLLPHAKLRELHALMLRTRVLERKQRAKLGAREALLAATAVHLLPGDLLCGAAADTTAKELAPVAPKDKSGKTGKIAGHVAPPVDSRLQAAAALARGLQGAGTDGLVLAYAAAGSPEPGWQAALSWANDAQLPLVLAVVDATGGAVPRTSSRAKETPLTWATMERFAKRLRLPVLAVDGEDAVAVYRVMQESVIRARYGGGPAVLWAVTTPPATALTRTHQPLARLERYLAVRNIKLPNRH